MKLVFLIGDGMADHPIPELGGRTPLEYAATPHMDEIARRGILGLARTVPPGMPPGSDTANLSIFGYDPRVSYTGRAPLEALSMGIPLGDGDVAFRCNIVTIVDGVMEDFSADHIESGYSEVVIGELSRAVKEAGVEFYPGVSYRNIMVWRDYPHEALPDTTPPHDIQGEEVSRHLPRGTGADLLNRIMDLSRESIAGSAAVRAAGKKFRGAPVSAWLWGCGRRPSMEDLGTRFGLRGHTISAVDLIHGIGRAAGLSRIDVPGATGYLDTDYAGKAAAALRGLEDSTFVFLHVESPDESGHEGNLAHKLRAIEDFDALVVGPVLRGLARFGRYAVLVLPDHPTPIALRTHTPEPVPFGALWSDGADPSLADRRGTGFSEREAAATGLYIDEGFRLIELMINKTIQPHRVGP
ncbi:MAG: cofactor-independent phosphoglycerate mutase [Spirochaetes bacterium]|nr:cofactor-independent phosphoglycerate mutase [Spirochaetota bacterium]